MSRKNTMTCHIHFSAPLTGYKQMLSVGVVLFLFSRSRSLSSSPPFSFSPLYSLRNIDVLLVFICSHRPPSRFPLFFLSLSLFSFSSHLSDILQSTTDEYRHRQQANFLLFLFLLNTIAALLVFLSFFLFLFSFLIDIEEWSEHQSKMFAEYKFRLCSKWTHACVCVCVCVFGCTGRPKTRRHIYVHLF